MGEENGLEIGAISRASLPAEPTFLDWLNDEVMLSPASSHWLVSTICPHGGGPLSVADDGSELVCGWHGWRFSVASGECLNRQTGCKLRFYRISEDEIVSKSNCPQDP